MGDMDVLNRVYEAWETAVRLNNENKIYEIEQEFINMTCEELCEYCPFIKPYKEKRSLCEYICCKQGIGFKPPKKFDAMRATFARLYGSYGSRG